MALLFGQSFMALHRFAAVVEGKPSAHDACPSSNSWLRLVADLRISCSDLPRSASVSA
jgi:hypothetical protein